MLLVLMIYGCGDSEILSRSMEENIKMIFLSETSPTNKGRLVLVESKKIDPPSSQGIYAVELYCTGNNCFIQKGVAKNQIEANEVLCLLLAYNGKVMPITYYRKKSRMKEEGYIPLENKSATPVCPNYKAIVWHRDDILEEGGIEFSLGFMYQKGYGVQKNSAKAVKWYKEAAKLGSVIALNNLGNMYAGGSDIEQNNDEAIKWYRKAATKGDLFGELNLEALQKKSGNNIHVLIWYERETVSDAMNLLLSLPPAQGHDSIHYNNK